ncbi:unnamed protein product [Trichobilharzia regenti]|nr:unnamed protein product [Trichobilharzia regenti]
MKNTSNSHSSVPTSMAAVAAAAAMAVGELSGGNLKKCRARFGLEHQNMWCKPCRYVYFTFSPPWWFYFVNYF